MLILGTQRQRAVLAIYFSIVLSSLSTTVLASEPIIAVRDTESWPVASAWISAVTPTEQIVVIFLLRSKLNNNLSQTVFERPGATADDHLWGLKSISAGNYILAKLATKSPALRKAIDSYVLTINRLIGGSISENEYTQQIQGPTKSFSTVLQSVNAFDATDAGNKYDARINETSKRLIAMAKGLASAPISVVGPLKPAPR